MADSRRVTASQAIKRLAGWWGAPLLGVALRLSSRRRGLALAYHEILADEDLHAALRVVPAVSRSDFVAQLRYLRAHYRVVPFDGFLEAIRCRRRGQRFPICVTFDDDAPEHVSNALPVLGDQRVPATFFLSGAFLDDSAPGFWWQQLQRALDREVPLEAVIATLREELSVTVEPAGTSVPEVAAAIEELPTPSREEAALALRRLAGPEPDGYSMTPCSVSALLDAGCDVGFHTRRHYTLTRLDDEALEHALLEGRHALSCLTEKPVDAIAYPHGKADRRVADAARRAGYRVGFTNRPCASTPASDPLLLGRLAVTTTSRGAFALTLVRALLSECNGPGP